MSRPMQPALPWRLYPARARLALRSHARLFPLTLIALTWIGFAMRLVLLSTFPLREDEAIYGYWARAATSDPFFLHVWPDKPPLFIWLLSGAFALLGPSEATARLVSIFAGTLTIPLVGVGARRLWGSRTAGLMAALLLTLNPYAVSFAPTAYTDPLMVFFGLGAVTLALGGHGLGAGLLLGAACMTKQQGLFYAPLVVALLFADNLPRSFEITPLDRRVACTSRKVYSPHWSRGESKSERCLRHDRARGWVELLWALLGAGLIVLPILWWDSRRWAVAPSPWALAQQTYAPLVWLSPQDWLARGQEWAKLLWYLGGSWTVWGMIAAALGGSMLLARRRPRVALMLGWGLCFVLLHVVTSVQVWDRYLLPLAPWLALVASGPLAMVAHPRLPEWGRGVLFLLLVVGMGELVTPGLAAARGQMPLGGDHGDYAGLREAIAWVEDACEPPYWGQSPHPSPPQTGEGTVTGSGNMILSQPNTYPVGEGTVVAQDKITLPHSSHGGEGADLCPAILYHQVLGWHFRFYLYDELQPRGDDPSRFELRWFPSAAYLADNAAKSPYPPKYLIVPDWATPRDLALHLAMRGLRLEPQLHVGRFAVMEITQPPRPLCDWCKSSLPSIFRPFVLPKPTLSASPQMSMP